LVCLYVTSVEEGAGKTAVCAGLGKHLVGTGKKVAFFKPILARGEQSSTGTSDHDALFMKQVMGLDEPVDSICPVIAGQNEQASSVKKAYTKVSSGKDVVITEGECEPSIVEALDAKVIAVESYSNGLKFVERYKGLGKHLLGIVLNKVPASKLERVRDKMTGQLKETGIDILGVLPEDRLLFTLSIGELAGCIQGEILNSSEQSAELVESLMVGAMTVDPGPVYFGRKKNKAVVVRSNRPDMQLAALETSTRCLILCGDASPTTAVMYEAGAKKVPIVLTEADIITTVGNIEFALGRSRFRQEKKLPKLAEIVKQNFNFPVVYKLPGLAG
jgi:BioD-like phosphotransacetylase family protein